MQTESKYSVVCPKTDETEKILKENGSIINRIYKQKDVRWWLSCSSLHSFQWLLLLSGSNVLLISYFVVESANFPDFSYNGFNAKKKQCTIHCSLSLSSVPQLKYIHRELFAHSCKQFWPKKNENETKTKQCFCYEKCVLYYNSPSNQMTFQKG